MKTLEDFKQEQMKDEDFKREYDEIQFIANSRAIQELEKIKAEIDNCLIHNPNYDECNVNMGLGISYEIIKKHIAELKGE